MLAVEGVGLLGLSALQFAQVGRSSTFAAVGVAFVAYAVFLLIVARGLLRRTRWCRGPAIAVQLIQLPIAWTLREGQTRWLAAVLGVTAVLAVVGLLLPSSTAALVPPDPEAESAPKQG